MSASNQHQKLVEEVRDALSRLYGNGDIRFTESKGILYEGQAALDGLVEQYETLLDLLRVSVGFWIATPQEFIEAQHRVPNRDKVEQIAELLSNPASAPAPTDPVDGTVGAEGSSFTVTDDPHGKRDS